MHSTVRSGGRTTIPVQVREALRIKPGAKLEYTVAGNYAIIRVRSGPSQLKGALRSEKGRDMSFAQIRAALKKAATDGH